MTVGMSCRKTISVPLSLDAPHVCGHRNDPVRGSKRPLILTHPTTARQDALFRKQGRSEVHGAMNKKSAMLVHAGEVHGAKNNEVHDVQNNARQVCERARDGERPVS